MMASVCRACDAQYSIKEVVISEVSGACDAMASNGLVGWRLGAPLKP